MKLKAGIFCLLGFLVLGALSEQKEKTSFPHLTGMYFGQKAPGSKAELFAPGLISQEGRYEFAPSFSPEGNELLFTAGVPEKPVCVYYTRISNGRWVDPEPVSLSKGAKKEEMEAFFSPDGRYIFFSPYDEGLDVRIWKLDIHEDGWKNPQPLKGNISDESAFFPTCSNRGTLYFTNIKQRKIYKALLEKGVVKESGEAGLEFGGHGFTAPDESFMLVDANQQDSRGKLDIYVAFRKEDGGWSKPVNLGDEVNTEHNETCPTLSSDGKYLFFSRYNEPGELSNIYWIDASVIEELRPTESIRVPDSDGRPVLLDGLFSPGEWEDAEKIEIHSNVHLYMKKYKGHVFIGVNITPYKTSVVDMFISPDGKTICHMHTSAQISERLVNENSGPWDNPSFVYGYSVDWYANEIRWDNKKMQALMKEGKSRNEAQEMSYFEYDGFEFQIKQSKFSSDQWLFRIEVPQTPDWDKPIIYPTGTVMKSTKGWVRLELDDDKKLKGPYLGQKPPGKTPVAFAPDILNTEEMGAFCSVFSPDGEEFYFVYYERKDEDSGGLAWMRKINDVWTEPEFLPFNSSTYDNDMCMSADGNMLVFRSWRALPNEKKPKDHSYLWFVERTDEGWSKAKPLQCGGVPVRTGYPSLAANGTIYFALRGADGFGIYRSKPVNGVYGTPEHVFTAVDTIDTEGDMFVAPDESYMIISCWDHPGNIGSGQGDLYITFQKDDGRWTDEINMGELINTQYGENCPQVSPDGKYFFFNRYNPDAKEGNIYWVDAKIIEDLKPIPYQENEKKFGTADLFHVPGSCTIFAASFGNTVLYGNNEDYRIPKTYYWAEPSGEKTYGGVFLGLDNFDPQGGINEKGLAFDINALPEAPLNFHPELPGCGDIIKKIYQTCATVEEAIGLAKKHNWGSSLRGQVLLADATGDAVVISAGPDRELAFTRKAKGDGYLVSTNFNRANPENTYRGGYPCWRYNKAVEMLEKIKDERSLTVDYFKSILDACHVEGPVVNTLYSNVFDLKNGVIHLYHWHQFDETAVLKVADEITKKRPPTRIRELFSQETVKRAEDEYQRYKEKK